MRERIIVVVLVAAGSGAFCLGLAPGTGRAAGVAPLAEGNATGCTFVRYEGHSPPGGCVTASWFVQNRCQSGVKLESTHTIVGKDTMGHRCEKRYSKVFIGTVAAGQKRTLRHAACGCWHTAQFFSNALHVNFSR